MIGRLIEEDRAPPVVLEQEPGRDRPDRRAGAGDAGPDGDRLGPLAVGNTLVRIDSVDGMTNAAPTPMIARAGDEPDRMLSANAPSSRADGEDDEADLQRALAAEAVAERAGGEEQAGEDERVGVDDPLQLGVRGAETARSRRCSVGSATLSTVLPTMTMISDVQRTARIFHRRW